MGITPNILFFDQRKELCEDLIAIARAACPVANIQFADNDDIPIKRGAHKKYDTIICHVDPEGRTLHRAIKTANDLEHFVPVLGLQDSISNNIKSSDFAEYEKLCGIFGIDKGLAYVWEQIEAVLEIWATPAMKSHLDEIPLSDVLQMVSASQRTSIVRISGFHSDIGADSLTRGCISFVNGQPQIAWSTRNNGIDAIYELLALDMGVLELIKPLPFPAKRNLFQQVDQILFTYAIHHDELLHNQKKADLQEPDIVSNEMVAAESGKTEIGTIPPPAQHQDPQWPSPAISGHPIDFLKVDRWWYTAKETLGRIIISKGDSENFLVRWMTQAALAESIKRVDSPRVIVFAGTAAVSILTGFAHILAPKKISGVGPVLRKGRIEGATFYLAGIESLIDLDAVFHNSPCVISGSLHECRSAYQIINKKKIPLGIFATADASATTEMLLVDATTLSHPSAFFCMQSPQIDPDKLTAFMEALVNEIASISEGGNP